MQVGGWNGRKLRYIFHTTPFCGPCSPSSGTLVGDAVVDPEDNTVIDHNTALFVVSFQKKRSEETSSSRFLSCRTIVIYLVFNP